jgi:hypothetical protein
LRVWTRPKLGAVKVTNSRGCPATVSGTPLGSYRWRGELRLWDNEALIGWYRSTDAAVRSKGTLYLALHQHGEYAWGRWVGMSYDGAVVSGWGAIARTEDQANQAVLDLINESRP